MSDSVNRVNDSVNRVNGQSNDSSTTRGSSTSKEREPASGNILDSRQAPDLRQQGRLFRSLMATPLTARELADLAARGNATELARWVLEDTRDTFKDSSDDSQRSDVDVSAMLGAQHAIDQGPTPQAVVAAGAPDQTFAELFEKHVRRALASQDASQGSTGGEMRIELSDAVLPGTSLALRRTSEGWRLSASSDNRQSLDRLNQYAPALVERFARASLGRLEISVGDG